MASQSIHVTLREHGPQPGGEAAPSVKIAKERLPLALALTESEEIGVQRVGEIPRAAGRVDRIGCPVQERTLLKDEVLPGSVVSGLACAGESEIFKVKRAQIAFEIDWRLLSSAEPTLGARQKLIGEALTRDLPPLGACPTVQAVEKPGVNGQLHVFLHASGFTLLIRHLR
jgi:hypothetical protein